jgi:predicted component of type VI protein secretion system
MVRTLGATDPTTFVPQLAEALNYFWNWLTEAGRRKEALATIEEAVQRRRELAAANPAGFNADLACTLQNFSPADLNVWAGGTRRSTPGL